jgi:PAS domain S-box-containing protein
MTTTLRNKDWSATVAEHPGGKPQQEGVDFEGVSFRINEVADPALVIDGEHRIVNANGQLMRLFALSEDDMERGLEVHDLVPEQIRDAHRAYVDSLFRTPIVRSMADPRSNVRGVTKDGRVIPIMVTFYPIKDLTGLCTHYAAIVVERRLPEDRAWRRVENWLPAIIVIIAAIGWFLQIPGALELLIGVTGVRSTAEVVKRTRSDTWN